MAIRQQDQAQNFKIMQTLNVETIKLIGKGVLNAQDVAALLEANMVAEAAALDAIERTRVCAIVKDAQDLLAKDDPKTGKIGVGTLALEEVAELYPDKYVDGTHFEHGNGSYCVDIKKSLRMVDENGKPKKGTVYTELRRIDAQKKELTNEQSHLTKRRAEIVNDFAMNHPKAAEFDITRTLKVMRK